MLHWLLGNRKDISPVTISFPLIHRNHTCELHKISVYVAYGRGSVLFWWRCNTLCTSSFLGNVMFSYNRPYGGVTLSQQPRYNVVYNLTPLIRGIGSVLS